MQNKDDIIKRETYFSVHIPSTDNREDMHYVRQNIFYKNGNIEPVSFLVKDFKRPIWVVKKQYRNYNDKKEFEYIDRLYKQYTTQSDINRTVANLLEKPYLANKPDEIRNSPYVYGYDITSTSLIKYSSLKKNNFIQSLYTVASCDIETNPITNEIILISIAYKNKVYTGILKKFVHNISNLKNRVNTAFKYYLPKYSDMEIDIEVSDTEVEMLTKFFDIANKWSPVFLSIWNMNFDIPKILERLNYYNVNPIDVICDKTIPRKYRVCRYKQGISKKVTASGVVKPINPSLQWHTLISTTRFYVIDAMCVYRQLRIAKQEESSYSLDYILKKELNTEKLKFKEADNYSGINWHLFLQEKYPIEYIIYNMYDCISMLELDKKLKDLSSTLPSFAGITDFSRFNSNPKKIVDALFLFGLERNRIIGTVGKINDNEDTSNDIPDSEDDDIDEDNDEDEVDVKKYKTLGLNGWIQLLPQNLLIHDGLKCIKEYPNLVTNARGMVCDQDASAAYPSATLVANVSKETCINELVDIENISESIFREQNLSVPLGNLNMLEYFNVMFNMPSLIDINKIIDDIQI